ncbi:hypothetical protein ACF0H5_017646 [Mactra antiquata]
MASFSVEDETRPETREQNIPTFIKPSNKKISRDVSKYFDGLGFSRTQIWNRIHYMNINSKVVDIAIKFNKKTNNERILIGSQREGLGLSGLSDLDVLQVEHDVICTKKALYVDDARLVVKIVDSNTPPGYCQLKVDKSAVDSRIFKEYKYATVQRDGNTFLSSMQFLTELKDDMLNVSKFTKKHTSILPQHGPSIPKLADHSQTISLDTLYPERKVQSDFVRAFQCDERTALNVWQNRPRKYDWPSRRLIGQIMTLPIYVVPVGHKGSINEDLEWRISFVWAEIKLVQSFNNIQMKIFLLLKLVAKHYLDSESEITSSYVIKNIMFWLAEDIPQKKFRQKHLMARMIDALQKLKESVMTKSLQTYMQPERNLFANKLNDAAQQLVLSKIDYIMCHGQTKLCRFLYDEGPSNKATKTEQIVNDLQTRNLTTKYKICEFLQIGTKNALHIFLIKLNLKSEKELFIAATYFQIMKNANTSVANIKNDTYCSRKLIEADKELRATTIMDIKTVKFERWRINTVTFITRFVSKLLYLPTKKKLLYLPTKKKFDSSEVLNTPDRDTKPLIQQSGQKNKMKERTPAPPVVMFVHQLVQQKCRNISSNTMIHKQRDKGSMCYQQYI